MSLKPRGTLLFLLVLLNLTIFPLLGLCEGTKQLMPDSAVSAAGLYFDNSNGNFYPNFGIINCPPNYRLYIHVKSPGEKILFGMQGAGSNLVYNLRKPNGTIALTGTCPVNSSQTGYITYYHQAIVGPFPQFGGYMPISFTVTSLADTGNYYFELVNVPSSFAVTFDYWDFQVVSGQHSPAIPADTINGRVWSQSWQVYADLGNYVFQPFNGKFYVYSDDGIVTQLAFSNAHVGAVTIFCNPYGCLNTGDFITDRQSMNTNTYVAFPEIAQYKVFLSNPDITLYPSGVYGQITGIPYMVPDPAFPPCSAEKQIVVNVDKSGRVEVKLTFPYGGSSTDVTLYSAVVPGLNYINWNGLDGSGNMPPDGTVISGQVKYLNGLTNLPVWDQERNPEGYLISLVRPANPQNPVPLTYWDDTQLITGAACFYPPQSGNLDGCVPGSIPGFTGCHPWNENLPDCHDKMINTWWYGSTSSVSFDAVFDGLPVVPQGHDGHHCGPGTVELHATVPATQTVDWYAAPTGGNPLLTGDTTFITPLINVTTTFYAEARTVADGCISGSRAPAVAYILPAPVATISGPDSVCTGTWDNFYTTEPGMTGYSWSVTPGGGIVSGSGTNTIEVIWNITGDQSVTVSYIDPTGCPSFPPTIFPVRVNPLPLPSVTGPSSVCKSAFVSEYFTETGMIDYFWTITQEGTIISGQGTDRIEVIWNSAGTGIVTVTYKDDQGCSALNPAILEVMIHDLPVPLINGPSLVCAGTGDNFYSTEPGMSDYSWMISGGGTITGGSGSNGITVTWETPGNQWVSAAYTDANGCRASPVVYNVKVNPLPVPGINGPGQACIGSAGNEYSTEPGMAGYLWSVSPGGMITSGAGTNAVNVTWSMNGVQSINVTYTDTNGCTPSQPSLKNVLVQPLPDPCRSISGASPVCAGESGIAYEINPVLFATGYAWTVPAGATISAGQGTNRIIVDFSQDALSGTIIVFAANECGNGMPSPPFNVVIHKKAIVNAGEDKLSCGSEPITLTGATAQNYSSLAWSTSGSGTFDDPSRLHAVYTPGTADIEGGSVTLYLAAESQEQCPPDSDQMILTLSRQVVVSAGSDQLSCGGEPFQLQNATASHYSSLSWKATGTGIFSDSGLLLPVYTPGQEDIENGAVSLILTGMADPPCEPSLDTMVLAISRLPAVEAGQDGSVCKNHPFTVTGSVAENYTSFTWSHNGSGTITAANTLSPVYHPSPDETGVVILRLTATGVDACAGNEASDQLQLDIWSYPQADAGPNQTIDQGSSTTLSGSAEGGSGNFAYQWEPAALLIQNTVQDPETIGLTSDTTFFLAVTDLSSGCVATDSIRIAMSNSPEPPETECIKVPNVITPNGDGDNDTWIIDCIGNFPQNKIVIFDRWGDRVNEFENYDNQGKVWNGTNSRGEKVPDGTYYYVLTLNGSATKTGWIFVRGGN